MYHIGKVQFVYSPSDKNVISSNNSVQATLYMWDENLVTATVSDALTCTIKVGDTVLVDYSPVPGTSSPRFLVSKILKGKIAKDSVKAYEDFLAKKKKPAGNTVALPFPNKQIT